VLAAGLSLAAASLAGAAAAADKPVTLSGCLIRGEDDGYLLTNEVGTQGTRPGASGSVAPGPVGTSGTASSIFYWLGNHKDLANHVGHRVEIAGEVESDLKDGDVEVAQKSGWIEMRIRSAGRSMKAQVPDSFFVEGAGKARKEKYDVLVRTVDVDKVRMIAAKCGE
jgi:hypothetical protein